MYHDDPIKKRYDDIVRNFVDNLRVIERNARACSEVAGFRDGIAMRLQADVVEAMHIALQRVLDAGGMPSLKEIDKIMNNPDIVVSIDREAIQAKLKVWSGPTDADVQLDRNRG